MPSEANPKDNTSASESRKGLPRNLSVSFGDPWVDEERPHKFAFGRLCPLWAAKGPHKPPQKPSRLIRRSPKDQGPPTTNRKCKQNHFTRQQFYNMAWRKAIKRFINGEEYRLFSLVCGSKRNDGCRHSCDIKPKEISELRHQLCNCKTTQTTLSRRLRSWINVAQPCTRRLLSEAKKHEMDQEKNV